MNEIDELRSLLREALPYVGAGEIERDYLWEGMRIWHFRVSTMFGVEPEAWGDPSVMPFKERK